ncbi:MAG: hypothetical protein N2235_13260 [Fischerella sp.]|nr:hypothetical protein [Fischerella sp.]
MVAIPKIRLEVLWRSRICQHQGNAIASTDTAIQVETFAERQQCFLCSGVNWCKLKLTARSQSIIGEQPIFQISKLAEIGFFDY